eukprot:gene16761-18455_t
MENFEKIKFLGKGGCAVVYLVKSKLNERLYALKEIQLDSNKQTRTKEHVLKEVRILEKLKHPHIVVCHDSFFDPRDEYLCILQDYCDGGTLYDKIQDSKKAGKLLEENQILKWFVQIVMAVQYIHSKKVLHRDLKTQNVFLMRNDVAKLGDFGIAKVMDSTIDMAQTCVGTPCYLSPEVCQDIPYTSKADMWALGCMLYEMCTLQYAFDATSLLSLYYKIVKGDYKPIDGYYSDFVIDLVSKLLSNKPEDRPSAAHILNNEFIHERLSNLKVEYQNLQEVINTRITQRLSPCGNLISGRRPASVASDRSSNSSSVANPRSKSAVGYRKTLSNVQANDSNKKNNEPDTNNFMSAKETGNYADDFIEDGSDDDEFGEDATEAELGDIDKEAENEDNACYDYPDDFEDIDEEDELEIEGVLDNVADILQKNFEEEDIEEVIEEEKTPFGNSNIAFVRERCREFLGEVVFDKVEEACRENLDEDNLRPEFQRIAGSEVLETCFLVNELVLNEARVT